MEKRTLKLTGENGRVKARQRMKWSRSIDKVQEALFTTDEDYLYVYIDRDQDDPLNVERDPRPDYWIRFVYGNDGWDVISDYSSAKDLDPYLGDGTLVQKLIDYAEKNGVVPDLYNRVNGKIGVDVD